MTKFIKILLLTISLGFAINLTNISASHALFEKGICVSKIYGSKINIKYSYSGKCKEFNTFFISKDDYPSYQGKKYSGFDGSGANKKYGTNISISSMMNRYRSDEVINKVYKNFDYYKKNKNYDFYIIDLSTFNIGKFKNGEFIADSKIDQKKLNFCADIFYGKEALEDGYFTDANSCPLATNTYQIADKIKWDFNYSINFSKAYLDQKSFYINTTGTYSIFLGKKQTQFAKNNTELKPKKKVEVAETIKVGDIPSINIFDTNNYKHRIFFELENKTYNAFTLKNEIRNELHLWFNEYEDGIIGNYNYEMIMSINSPVIVFSKTNKLGEHLKIVHWNNHKTELGNNLGNLYKTITYESKNEDFTYYQYIDKNHQITYGVYNKIKKKWDAHTSLGQDWLLKKGLLTETGKTPDEQLELIKKAQLITKGYKETEQKTIKLKNKFLGQINLKKPNFINSFTPTNIAGINILDNINFYLKKENLNEDVHVKNRNENNKKKTIYSNMINNGSKKIIDINIENNYFDNLYVKVDKNQIINNISFYKYLGTNKVYPDEEFCISERDNFINNLNIKNVNFNYDYLYDEMDNNKIYQDIKYNDFEYKNKKLRFEIACFNTINNEDSKRNKDIMYILGISLSNIEELNDVYIEQEVKRISRFTIDDINNNNYKIIDQIALTELQDEITISKKLEEFKPENKDIDNEAPIIDIADTITVKDTTYEIAGMVKDKSDTVYIEIDGQTILAENGKFKFQKYSPVDHQLQIVAIDQWGNKSEPKMVDVKINIQVAGTSKVIEPLNPSKLIAKIDRNKVALVIGVEKYENSPSAKYASLDAKYFKDYARKVFGVREDNINLLTDEEANLSKTNSAFFKWLPSKIKSNQTDLIIFYAGHGLASTDGKEKYILPFNADPDLLSRTAISRNEIFDQIISLNPRSVTIFFDTCYSGVSRDEQMLLASARPLRVIADDEEQLPDNFTIFSASKNDQISSGLSDAKHGIFSYFLMKGLEGKADLNGDRKLTNNELLTYLDDNVSEKALDLGRQQNPTLSGNPEQVLARY